MNLPNLLSEIRDLVEFNFAELLRADWALTRFKQKSFVVEAAAILIAAFLLKISWPWLEKWWPRLRRLRNESYYEHSGYYFEKSDKPGWLGKILSFTPTLLVILASVFLLFAIADPYVLASRQAKTTQSREIIYLEDDSASMGFRFKNQDISRAEIVRDLVLKLIAERRDKNDRAAFMIYATQPYRITGFTTDGNSLLFRVGNAPLVIADPLTPTIEMYKGLFIVNDFMAQDRGGESDLFLGLEAAIKLFDEKGDPKITEEAKKNPSIKKRSIIIATDGASSRDPEPQFKELRKRGIVPYLVFIDPDKDAEKRIHGDNTPEVQLPDQLLKQVRQYGGEYFIAANRLSLNQIRRRLDRLHASIVKVKNYTEEQHIYRLPLTASLLLYALAILARLILWKFHLTNG